MNPQRTGIGRSVMALSTTVVVLAATFAYHYATSESQVSTLSNQVSTLKQSGHSFYLALQKNINDLFVALFNITQTLQQQVKSDNSMIATLDSTKPAGYEGMVATLNNEITQDQAIIGRINSFTALNTQVSSLSANTFCELVSQP